MLSTVLINPALRNALRDDFGDMEMLVLTLCPIKRTGRTAPLTIGLAPVVGIKLEVRDACDELSQIFTLDDLGNNGIILGDERWVITVVCSGTVVYPENSLNPECA